MGVGILTTVLLVWLGVQLLAQRQMGYRKLSCSGAVRDRSGKAWCCKGTGPCKEDDLKESQH